MNKRISTILILATVIITATIWRQSAAAGHAWAIWHHADQGRGQPAFEQCMPVESQAGHAGHEGDYEVGLCEDPNATPVPEPTETQEPTNEPTNEPTDIPNPTDAPEPTPTPTEEGDPTPSPSVTPTDEGCELECGPTAIPTDPPPVETPELPKAGFTSQYEITSLGEPWLVTGTTWAAHNQEGWIASTWWQLWEGVEFPFQDRWYVVTDYILADPTDVYLIDGGKDLTLITCRGYDPITNTWAQRLVIFAKLSEGS